MPRLAFILNETSRRHAISAIVDAPDGMEVTIKQPTRNLEQNAALWAALADVAAQVDWYGEKLTAEEWKDVLTAAWKRQRVVRGVDGGFVVIGARTSKMTKTEMSELLELVYAFGAEQGVRFRCSSSSHTQ